MTTVTLTQPDDFHVHLRDGDALKLTHEKLTKHPQTFAEQADYLGESITPLMAGQTLNWTNLEQDENVTLQCLVQLGDYR